MMIKEDVKKVPNKNQQICIDNLKGKYLVLAGPGTGKTFTIIERIKNMLAKGINPKKILCLTFTDAAANEMKKRIERELNIVSCGIQIYTYHSFCCDIIEKYTEEFEISSNYKVISDPVSRAFIKECIDEIKPVYFRTEKNDPYFYINTIKKRINLIKQNRINKEQYEKNLRENPDWEPEIKIIEEVIKAVEEGKNKRCKRPPYDKKEKAIKKVEQARELWKFYELYSKKMEDNNYLDFDDMINLVLNKYEKNPSFFHDIANQYDYIMVDEYQDTNKSQNEIVFALANSVETGNVFVVGDDDQIIYRFQGAKLDTIENFIKEFPETKIICLTDNMRSTQSILNTARAVIKQDPLSLANKQKYKDINGEIISKEIKAANEKVIAKDKPVRLYEYEDIMQEYTEIVNEIENLINSKECPVNEKTGEKLFSEIAILTRSNAEAESFANLLKLRNIPFELKEGKDIFAIPAVNILYFYIQFLINPQLYSYRMFELLVSQPFNINPNDYQILFEETSKHENFIEAIKSVPKNKFREPDKIEKFIKTYDYLNEYKMKESIKNTILEIGAKTGIFNYYLNNEINRTESIAGIKRFLDEAVGFSEIYKTSFLEEYNNYLKDILKDEETIKTEKAPVTLNAVQLCTYHSSKGREFEYVYMPTLDTYKWERRGILRPDIPLDISEYKTEDELRDEIKPSDLTKLMYVAMTRAKHTLRMSFSRKINDKPRELTKFIVNIQEMFEREPAPFEYDEISFWEQTSNLLTKRAYDYKKDFEELIQAKLNDRAFSPSAINKYLACPRQYMYNLINLPPKDGNPNFLSYGAAIHKACEEAICFIKNKKFPPEKFQFVKWFKDELAKLPMENYAQREVFEGRGEKALDKFYCQIINVLPSSLDEVEVPVNYTLEDGTKFTGFIDRVDKNEDGTFTIYDYKTGNNKNKEINPGKDHEDYYNQMGWYKYFYEKLTGNKVTLTKFIYPEDFESKNDGITYTDEEIEALVEKFKTAVNNIKNCQFEPSYNENTCKYCTYKDFCGMNII